MPRCPGFVFAVACVFGLGGTTVAAQSAPGAAAAPIAYHLVKSVPLGAPDGWDYVIHDPSSGRVFVAHGNRLTVVDGRSGRIVGQVGPIAGGPHGTAFDPPPASASPMTAASVRP
jgi:hypothetical protein